MPPTSTNDDQIEFLTRSTKQPRWDLDPPGWGVEIEESVLGTDDYVRWERVLPIRPDGSTGYV
ncbi:hypothetical protein [Nonomuraea polychroma]|uniref:hypothetical protein n=1 Tax=Nonomuraea polychroma TaxID=46176 RepID=UPI000FDEEF47|nr:hypothetical protein [Nonomuraea polychroma]